MVSSGSPGVPGSSAGVAGAGRERLAFPGAACPWGRDDGRSARPAASSPAPARPTAAGIRAGRPAWGNGERRKAPRPGCAAGQDGGPALPEGKAGRGGRGVVPGGDLVRALAVAGGGGGRPGCRPAGRAGLPPGTAGIYPRLCPPGQVRQARRGRAWRPAAARRHRTVPAAPAAGGPEEGPAAAWARRKRRGGADHPRSGCCRRAAPCCGRRVCHGRLVPRAAASALTLHKSGFRGLFSPARRK